MTNKNTGEHRTGSFFFASELMDRRVALRMDCVTEDAGRPFLFFMGSFLLLPFLLFSSLLFIVFFRGMMSHQI
jgi:hypothetical protein